MLEIENAVSETLLIPLYIKYLSSQQPDPILYDAAACRLIPQIEYDFSKFDHAYRSIAGTAIRAHYFDNMTADFIRHRKNPVIVELGCGLDSRHERLGNRAGEAPFYLLDLPDVIALREKLLPPRAGETLIAASAFDEEWMDNLLQSHPDAQFLFLIEGVLMYFPKENVRELFQKLAQQGQGDGFALRYGIVGQIVEHGEQAVQILPPVFEQVAVDVGVDAQLPRLCHIGQCLDFFFAAE